MLRIRFAQEWKGEALLGVLCFAGVTAQQRLDPLWRCIEEACRDSARKYQERALSSIEGIQKVRRLYKKFGLDPTKNRPSSEALLRRCMKGKPLYQVNSVVDVCNLCSLKFLLPIGLYDMEQIAGDATFRAGKPGEGFEGIQKGWVNLEKKILLCDAIGPFGNPSSDSDRTKITLKTTAAGMVFFAPKDFGRPLLEGHLREAADTMIRFNGGRVISEEILS